MARKPDTVELFDAAEATFEATITDDQENLFGWDTMIKSWRQPRTPRQSRQYLNKMAVLRTAYERIIGVNGLGTPLSFDAYRGDEEEPLKVNLRNVIVPEDIEIAGEADVDIGITYIKDTFVSELWGELMVERAEVYRDPSQVLVRTAIRAATFHEARDINKALSVAVEQTI